MTKKLIFIDNLRAIATLFVLMCHLGYVFWYQNGAVAALLYVEERSGIRDAVPKFWDDIAKAIDLLNVNFGMLGVAIFFLISGFVIPYSVEKNREKGNKCLFLVKRFLRIWPVYILGFGITFSALQFYAKFSGGNWIFSMKDFLVQASLLRDWFWIPSIDGISWTLEIEIKFYAFFFLLFLLKRKDDPKSIIGIALTIVLLSVLYSANKEMLLVMGREYYIICSNTIDSLKYMIYILMGLGFHCLYAGKWDKKVWLVVEEVLIVCFLLSVHWLSPELEISFWVNYISAFLIFLNAYLLRDRISQGRFFRFFANNSFSIYILHGVNGYILLTIFYDMGIPMYINLPIVIIIVLFVSWLFHQYVEEPIGKLAKKYVISRFEK